MKFLKSMSISVIIILLSIFGIEAVWNFTVPGLGGPEITLAQAAGLKLIMLFLILTVDVDLNEKENKL